MKHAELFLYTVDDLSEFAHLRSVTDKFFFILFWFIFDSDIFIFPQNPYKKVRKYTQKIFKKILSSGKFSIQNYNPKKLPKKNSFSSEI